jgi:hypothetical protein
VEESVAVERGTDRLNQMLNKSALASPIWAHHGDQEARGLRPSADKPHAIGKQNCYQPQWISHKARSPRLRLNLREERVQVPAGTCLDDAYLECAKEEFTR